MNKLALLALTAALAAGSVQAQAPAAAGAAPAAPASPAKRELVQRVLKAQQGGVDAVAQALAEAPAMQLMQQAGAALQQRVPADKREAVAKEIQADVKKYADEAVPLLRDRAQKLAPSVLGPMLEERFNEDELRQLATWMESPVSRKYAQMGGEMQRALAERVANDARSVMEPKLQALQASMAKRLGLQQGPAASSAAPAQAPKKK